MASLRSQGSINTPNLSMFLLIATATILTISPFSHCQSNTSSCTVSNNIMENRSYPNCTQLPQLGFELHWSFVTSDSILSVAVVAHNLRDTDYMAYGVNLNLSMGMVGAETLIAFRVNGSMSVKPYKLISYREIKQTTLSFPVSGLKAKSSANTTVLFAVLHLPSNTSEIGKVRQVWQTGAIVNGFPQRHLLVHANLQSKETLELTNGPSAAAKNETAGSSGGARARERIGFVIFIVMVGSFIVF